MYALILLLAFCVFTFGVLVGFRWHETNLRGRERALAAERRRVNTQIRALGAHHEVNKLIWQAQNELREDALAKAQDMPFVIDHGLGGLTAPRRRNGPKIFPERGINN